MFDFNVCGHIFQLFGLFPLSDFNLSCGLYSQIRRGKGQPAWNGHEIGACKMILKNSLYFRIVLANLRIH